MKKGLIIGSVLVLASIAVAFLSQPPAKTEKIYREALADVQKENYQNAYYLFSRISFFSPLKPIAIYHQADCAAKIEDNKTAVKKYKTLFKIYPK